MIFFLANLFLKLSGQRLARFRTWHLLLDLVLAVSVIGAVAYYGFTLNALICSLLIICWLIVSVTDFTFKIIPDSVSLTYLILGLILSTMSGDLTFTESVIGVAVGFSLLFIIGQIGSIALKKQAMGGGDIKLAAALGAFVGWQDILLAVFAASTPALVYAVAIAQKRG